MKLMYELPDADKRVLETASSGERLMYCIPYNIESDRFVKGFLAITDKRIYKLLNG